MNRGVCGWVCGVMCVLAAAASSVAQSPPNTRVLDCTTSGCHSKQLDHKFLHGPTAVKSCDSCHEYADPLKHAFTLKRQGQDLCSFCHMDKTGLEGPVVHDPVSKGQCTSCHDPHGSNSRRMLKRESVPQLCTECHKTVLDGKHTHGPAATDCLACHKAHTADHAKLLVKEGRDLCINCHADVGKSVADAVHPHQPATGDCLQCHTPHSSNEPKALKAPPAALCSECHKDVGIAATTSTHPHSAATEGRACLNCHVAHGSSHDMQLAADPVKSCLVCHKVPIKTAKGRTIAALTDLAIPSMHKHGPIQNGDCAGCHDVHGGSRDLLLIAGYSREFYQPFSDEAYALCFKCHDKNLAASEKVSKETGFRDGDRNLHYVHVTKETQGRSCRACHEVHASKFQAQIAEGVTFGQWKLPINFAPTMTGGSCEPGCHKQQKYDRRPLTERPPEPTGAPGSPAPTQPGGR